MNQEVATQTQTEAIRASFEKMTPEFKAALPAHIPPERFKRIALTAINANPDLWECEGRSLMAACIRAAQDGLLPDGREAALVIFKTKNRAGTYDKLAVYMPMVGGIIKKLRQSGEVSSIAAHVVYEKDEFDYEYGDNEHIFHRPLLGADRGKPIGVYAISHLKDKTIQREFMTTTDVEKVRAVSKTANKGPWVDWWDEMAKKTVIRRLAKVLPQSSDLDRVFLQGIEPDFADHVSGALEAPARPTRAKRAAVPTPAKTEEAGDDAKDVTPEPKQAGPRRYQFVKWDGEIEDNLLSGIFCDRIDASIKLASDIPTLQGVKENNEAALDALLADPDEQTTAWHKALQDAYAARIVSLTPSGI